MPSSTAYSLLEACRAPGCPVCRLEQRAVERYLDNKFYESVNSPAWRDELRQSFGFCHEHSWLAVTERLGDALGFSIISRDLVNSIQRQLTEEMSSSASTGRRTSVLNRILAALTPRKRCPVCEHRDETTRRIISALVEELDQPNMTDALESSDGLCLPHLRLVLEQVKDVSDREALLTIHLDKLESLRAELDEFIRKSEYQAVREGFGSEGNAWQRAVSMIVGARKEK
ncbi:MAG TPA: DUF6062 family protein [Anaerolineales bacterium]|nr:DUF6062 family protein [Anaerolineales bacterium]